MIVPMNSKAKQLNSKIYKIMGQTIKQKMIAKSKKNEDPIRVPFKTLLQHPKDKPKKKRD